MILSQLILVPIYVKYLGMESYGLVGWYTGIQAIFFLLDMGLSATIQKELSIVDSNSAHSSKITLFFTLERIYYAIAVGIIFLMFFLIKVFPSWFSFNAVLPSEIIEQAIIYIAILLAVRFPIGYYSGALNGIQKQAELNLALVTTEILKFISIYIALVYFKGNILDYFIVQIIFNIVLIVVLFFQVRKYINVQPDIKKFDWSSISSVWKYSVGMASISIVGMLITQVDKLILSRLVNLSDLGIYCLAFTIASLPTKIVGSVATAYFPKMVKEHSLGNWINLESIYLSVSQLVSILVIPISLMFILISKPLLVLWLGVNQDIEQLNRLIWVFTLGYMCNGLVTMPYYLQLTHGWTSLSAIKNIVALCILVPALILLSKYWGIYGASFVWLILNFSYLLFEVPIMHRRLHKHLLLRWYKYVVVVPLIIVVLFALFSFEVLNWLNASSLIMLLVVGICTLVLIWVLNEILPEKPIAKLFNDNKGLNSI